MKLRSITFAALACSIIAAAFGETPLPANDRHVVVVVWDGMRPDFVSERSTPALWKLMNEGVTFRHHHSVYPTLTNVNGVAIATGLYPNRTNVLANREYRPRIDPQRAFEHAQPDVIKKGDEISDGKYITSATVAEIVKADGRRTAIAGTKSVAFLHDRNADWSSAALKNSLIRFAAAPMPASLREETLHLLGPFLIEQTATNVGRNVYATRAMTEILWRDEVPAFSLLWLSEPDLTWHDHSPGAEAAGPAIRGSDRNLQNVLDALVKKKARDKTDVFVVSDHGFSTIERSIDFPGVLRAAGFDAVAAFEQTPKAGQIMVVGNGGSILFYIIEHDHTVAARLVEWLQHSDSAGVIFSREKFEGTLPLEAIHCDTPDAPDVMVALRWNAKKNRFGIKGQIVHDAARGAGEGSHASLSEFDVHNILVAAGPGFRRGLTTNLPSGNIDLAPTVLHLLGLDSRHEFDGRILTEALVESSATLRPVTEKLDATRKFPSGEWSQYLQISRIGDTIYFDEGNGAFEAR